MDSNDDHEPVPLALEPPPPEGELRRAADPTTAPSELRALAERAHPALWTNLAANPATPLETLLRLASRCPGVVAQNPSLRLHLLAEGEALLERTSTEKQGWIALLSRDELAPLLPAAVRHAALHCAVSGSPHAEGWMLRECFSWSALRDYDVEQLLPLSLLENAVILQHPRCPEDLIERVLSELAGRSPGPAQLVILSVEHWPERLLPRLAERPESGLRALAAGSPRLPPDAQRRLLSDPDIGVCRAAISNPAMPLGALAGLTISSDPAVRARVASCPRLPRGMVARLAADPMAEVRASAARNPALAPATLRKLSSDLSTEVRVGVATNPGVEPGVLRSLLASFPARIALSSSDLALMLRNPSLSPEQRLELGQRTPGGLQVLAGCPLASTALEWLATRGPRYLADIARNPSAPRALLERLACSTDESVAWGAYRQLDERLRT